MKSTTQHVVPETEDRATRTPLDEPLFEGEPALQAIGLHKRFGAVRALIDADLSLYPGKVHALVGGNGAGKSTLVKILSGTFRADEGEIICRGEKVSIRDPRRARDMGIETIHQNLHLVPSMDVVANVFLARELTYERPFRPLLRLKRMREYAQLAFERLGVTMPDTRVTVEHLSGGQRQAIACVRAMMNDPGVLIMDEPTAALGVSETKEVLAVMKRCTEEGTAVLMISHNMQEVFEISDMITVMRLGRVVGCMRTKDVTPEHVVGLITGAVDPLSIG